MCAYKQTGNITKTANALGVDRKTVRRWVHKYLLHGVLERSKGNGRKPILDEEKCQLARTLLLDCKFGTIESVAAELQKRYQITLGLKTLSRSIKGYAMKVGEPVKHVSGKPNKQLSKGTMEKRKQFCKDNMDRTWDNVMITDRCKFHMYYPGVKVKRSAWIRVGEEWVAPKVNHAQCLNVYAGITKHGVTKLHVVAGTTNHATTFTNKKGQKAKNITSSEYQSVVTNTFLPEGKRIFTAVGVSKWYLQQDNDPTHKKASELALREWAQRNLGSTVELLPNWPPNSPDLSPIENVWAYVQGEVNAAGCVDFNAFAAKVHETFSKLSKTHLKNLFHSMKTRVKKCIEKYGGKINY